MTVTLVADNPFQNILGKSDRRGQQVPLAVLMMAESNAPKNITCANTVYGS